MPATAKRPMHRTPGFTPSVRPPSVRAPSERPTSTRPPVVRLDSFKNPQPRTSTWVQKPNYVPQCNNPECADSRIRDFEGKLICVSCGAVVQEVQITNELTFGEASNGAAIVQGSYVGAGEDRARNSTFGNSKITGGIESRQVTERNGAHHIGNFVSSLRLSGTHRERSMNAFKLAMGINFIQGRTTSHVAAACVYLACRQDAENKVMLLDLSDLLQMNVFKLGKIYTAMITELGIKVDGSVAPTNPENLIQRFVQDLEFGADEHRIAREAVIILGRMKRDWMLTGRRPAGVCGAAIILAARMNNYRRTVREVVYTAKIGDATIQKRLDEFKVTESSGLTVNEFIHYAKDLDKEHDPPSFYRQRLEASSKKRRRNQERTDDADEDEEEEEEDGGNTSDPSEREASERPASPRARSGKRPNRGESASQRAQADSQAMPPPPIPIDPTLLGESSSSAAESSISTSQAPGEKPRRGRPKGSKNKPLPEPDEAMMRDEDRIESEINKLLQDPELLENASKVHREVSSAPSASSATPQPTVENRMSSVSNEPEIHAEEFEDDEEVANCVLTEEEAALKERVWVHDNADYLRKIQRRKIKKDLQERTGTAPIIHKRTRKTPRMGDMSQYVDENGNPIKFKNAKEATAAMMAKRGFRPPAMSKKINYDKAEMRHSLTATLLTPTPPRSRKSSSAETSGASGKSKRTNTASHRRQSVISISSSIESTPVSTPAVSRTSTPAPEPSTSRTTVSATPAAKTAPKPKPRATRASAFSTSPARPSPLDGVRGSRVTKKTSQAESKAKDKGKSKAKEKTPEPELGELEQIAAEGLVEDEEDDYYDDDEDVGNSWKKGFEGFGGEEEFDDYGGEEI